MTVTYTEYSNEKKAFFNKHHNIFETTTSPMDEYGVYYKTYCFKDGAVWNERMSPAYFKQEVEVAYTKVKVEVEVKLFETEYWNTEAGSKKYYEKW